MDDIEFRRHCIRRYAEDYALMRVCETIERMFDAGMRGALIESGLFEAAQRAHRACSRELLEYLDDAVYDGEPDDEDSN